MRILLLIVAMGLGRIGLNAALPDGGLFKPTFMLDDRSFSAGTAFLTSVEVERRTHVVLVSCHHVLGDSPGVIRAVAALAMTGPKVAFVASRIVPIKDAKEFTASGADGELSVFVVKAPPPEAKVLPLAPAMPELGEVVWLYARIYRTEVPHFYRGRVVSVGPSHLEYALDDPALELGGTSGAPIVNEQGEVVGINVGGRIFVGRLLGYANPVSAFRPKIMEAMVSAGPN